MGNNIYEENKALKREVQDLRQRLADMRGEQQSEADMMARAFAEFFLGNARLVIEEISESGAKQVRFEMPGQPARPELQP